MRRRAATTFMAAVPLVLAFNTAPAGAAGGDTARIQPLLTTTLSGAADGSSLTVLVHGTTIGTARAAARAAGLTHLTDLERIGVAVASGTPKQVRAVAAKGGVTYVEGDRKLDFSLYTSHKATRGAEAMAKLRDANGQRLTGTGVSVAVIDTGVDPMHPFFREADGSSAVVMNMKNTCLDGQSDADTCIVDAGTADTDALAAGGHGTHVNGIVAGRPVKLSDGGTVRGAAPGAKLVSISVGAGGSVVGADLAFEWVLKNHRAPCGPDVSTAACPPIRVTNNSYGSIGDFDPRDAISKLQRALVAEGVVSVWAQGNEGGNGSKNASNAWAQDPEPGILGVASYFDQNTGTRNGKLSSYSSRGARNRPATWPDISAPGEKITSSCRPYLVICSTGRDPHNGPGPSDVGTFNTISGTSMAAPHIAGIVAQLFQAKPVASPAAIENTLKATAYRYTDGAPYQSRGGGYRTSYDKGTGLVDVVAAVTKLTGSSKNSRTDRP